MLMRSIIGLLLALCSTCSYAENPTKSETPTLAFKLLMRTTHPYFSRGEDITVEVACVSLPSESEESSFWRASPAWQERWESACSSVRPEVEEARMGGYWGGVATMAWLQNRLHSCRLPAGQTYAPEGWSIYTQPRWRSITIPAEKLAGLHGMVEIRAEASINEGGKTLVTEYAQAVTALIEAPAVAEAELPADTQRSIVAFESSGQKEAVQLANKLLKSSTEGALRVAVRLFDNTETTGPLWIVIENSPHQALAIELMKERVKQQSLVPDYHLLLNLTGMQTRLLHPLEFEAEDRQPYTEYHPNMEKESVEYFRSLLKDLVNSGPSANSQREEAIAEIVEGIVEPNLCPVGTYGLTSHEAKDMLKRLAK